MGLPLSLARPLDATPAGTGVDCWATIKKDQEAQFECHPHIVGPTAKANGRERAKRVPCTILSCEALRCLRVPITFSFKNNPLINPGKPGSSWVEAQAKKKSHHQPLHIPMSGGGVLWVEANRSFGSDWLSSSRLFDIPTEGGGRVRAGGGEQDRKNLMYRTT